MFDSNFSNLVSFLLFPVKFIYERETYRTRSNVNKNLSREKKKYIHAREEYRVSF